MGTNRNMEARRPRFAAPIAADKIRAAPPPPNLFEILESVAVALPTDVPAGPVIGDGVGERKIVPVGISAPGEPIGPREPRKPREPRGPKEQAEFVEGEEGVVEVEAPKAALVPEPGALGAASASLLAMESRVKQVTDKMTTLVHPSIYIPTNRRAFKQFIIQSYRRYLLPKPSDIPDPDACAKSAAASKTEVKTFNYQSFVRDYIQKPSPYRGVLVYHGLGSGKTCTSIASMEALYAAGQKPVFIFTPASLSKNYKDEITKCGPFVFRTNNYWQFLAVPSLKAPTPEAKFLLEVLGLPLYVIRKQKGGWVPDPSKPANFDSLTTEQKKQIQTQIYNHIDHRFVFIHYNGLLEKTVRDWACNDPTKFDGATIVIDEVHNLVRTINNSRLEEFYKQEPRTQAQFVPKNCATGRKYAISYLVYRMLCNAVGCKIIALSGTPLINYPHELAILANLLSGDTRMVEATLTGIDKSEQILKMLERHPEVDFSEVVFRPELNASMVRITPVPSGCRKVIDPVTGAFRGFVRDTALAPTESEIARERDLDSWFQRVSAGVAGLQNPVFSSVTRLPDLEKPFRELFVDSERLEIKPRVKLPLMARLSGLISYYKGGKADLMAKVTKDEVVMIDMSDLQLKEYTMMRKEEIDKELREKKQKKPGAAAPVGQQGPSLYDQVTKGQKSTFKIFSRAACNFSFPNDLDRPRPSEFRDKDVMKVLGVADADKAIVGLEAAAAATAAEKGEVADVTEVAAEADAEAKGAIEATDVDIEGAAEVPEVPEVAEVAFSKLSPYERAIQTALSELRTRADEIFSPEMLPRYSPKYQAILDHMETSRGPVLVYSQFKTLEGIGLFAMAMEVQKGFKKFDIQQTPGGGWTLTPETRASGAKTPRYITYTGDEDSEKRNILKAVFNAAWSKLPANLAAEIKELAGTDNNQKGGVAKVFMITQSGAEGISLSNVRQVHIMEPYWNYVRLEQVKGRAIRICSHMDLPPEERTVEVFTYISRFNERQIKERLVDETLINFDGGETTDQAILRLSNAKKKLADALFEIMQGSAVDCELNANENGAVACYRFAGEPSMEPLFHPLVSVHLSEAEAAVRMR